MDITIRPAGPEDASFIAWVMITAGRSHLARGFWDQYVNGTQEECLAFVRNVALTAKPHPFHHSIFIIAEKDGKPLAGLSAYDPERVSIGHYLEALPEVFEKAKWSKADQMAGLKRIESFLTCLPDNAPKAWIIESVAAKPEARRQGITNLLLTEMIERGRKAGYERAQISVLIGNTPARRAYEKCGFRLSEGKRTTAFEDTYGTPGIERLLLEF